MPASYTDTEWIPVHHMTDKEKESHPEYQVTGGYLKIEDRKANRQAWWDGLDDTSKAAVLALPNFDAEIFKNALG